MIYHKYLITCEHIYKKTKQKETKRKYKGLQGVYFPSKSLLDQTQVISSNWHLTPVRCSDPGR